MIGQQQIFCGGTISHLSAADKELVIKAMTDVGIAAKADCHVSELSDGERQKVMIAKALAQQTPIIILDEPTAFLDAAARVEVLLLLHRLAAESQKAILLSTHDIDVAVQLSDNLWLMNAEGVQCGSVAEKNEKGSLDNLFKDSNLHFDAAERRFMWK